MNDSHIQTTKITPAVLLHQLREVKPEIKFDELFPNRTEEYCRRLATEYQILHQILDHPQQEKVSDPLFNATSILWKALNTFFSAVELARRGYFTEPLILARHVVECCSTALDVYSNPEKMKLLDTGRYSSTESIAVAKKIIPILGPFWGHLSETMTHINVPSSYPQWVEDGAGTVRSLLVGGGFDEGRLEHVELPLHM